MPASYPGAVYSPRAVVNKVGVSYDPTQLTKIYAEDKTKPDAEIVAIETELGTNPKGTKADVKTRLDDVDTAIGGKISKTTAGELAAMTEKSDLSDDDIFLIEDSDSANAKKKTLLSSILDYLTTIFDDRYSKFGNWLMDGDITFGENTSLVLDSALSVDGKYCGITEAGTAGAALAFGDLCYFNGNDSRWELVDANLSDGYDAKLGICVLAAAGDGSATKMLLLGKIRADSKFPALTIGKPAYISETAGEIVTAQPTTADACIRVVGYGNTADELYFNPSSDYIIHV